MNLCLYILNSILSTSLNVTPLKSWNPKERMFSNSISLLIITFPSLISWLLKLLQTFKEVKEVKSHSHIAPHRQYWIPWHLWKWRIRNIFQNHHHIYDPSRSEKPSSSTSASLLSRRAVAIAPENRCSKCFQPSFSEWIVNCVHCCLGGAYVNLFQCTSFAYLNCIMASKFHRRWRRYWIARGQLQPSP